MGLCWPTANAYHCVSSRSRAIKLRSPTAHRHPAHSAVAPHFPGRPQISIPVTSQRNLPSRNLGDPELQSWPSLSRNPHAVIEPCLGYSRHPGGSIAAGSRGCCRGGVPIGKTAMACMASRGFLLLAPANVVAVIDRNIHMIDFTDPDAKMPSKARKDTKRGCRL